MNTAVVIVNWNGKKYLKDCFDSLAEQTFPDFKIFFVDNGSNDGSVDFLNENFSRVFADRLNITKLKKNTGFAKGYNIGMEKVLEDQKMENIIILNNDTKLHKNCIEELVNCAKENPDVGSIQSRVLNFFDPGRIDCTGIELSIDGVATNRGYGDKDGEKYNREAEIFGANGTASLFTRKALESAKQSDGEYFDNSFFAYYEDVDLAWRIRLAGLKSFYCPRAVVNHVHSATASKISGFKAYYLNRNRFLMLLKNYPLSRLVFILLILTPFRYIFLFFRVIMKKGRKGAEFSGQKKSMVAKEILRAWGSVVANIPSILKKRWIVQRNRKVGRIEMRRWLKDYHVKFSKTF